MSARRKYAGTEFVYNCDRYRAPGKKDLYMVNIRNTGSIVIAEVYHHPTPKSPGKYLFGGLPNHFAPKLKALITAFKLKKVRRPLKERTGTFVELWW